MLANIFTASHSYPHRKPAVVVSHWIQGTGIIYLYIYRKKSTIHVGKYTVRPMDPSWGFRILLFEALLFFSKISGCIGQGFAKFDPPVASPFCPPTSHVKSYPGRRKTEGPVQTFVGRCTKLQGSKKRGSNGQKKRWIENSFVQMVDEQVDTLPGTNISHSKALLKMIMSVPWRVICCKIYREVKIKDWNHQLGAPPHFFVHRIPPWSVSPDVCHDNFVAFHVDTQDSQTWESPTMDY